MRRLLILIFVFLLATGCTNKSKIIKANESGLNMSKYQVLKKFELVNDLEEISYKYFILVDNESMIYKNDFSFNVGNSETGVSKYTTIEDNIVRNFINIKGNEDWYETSDEFRLVHFFDKSDIINVSKEEDHYIINVTADSIEKYLRGYEINTPFDFDYLNQIGNHDILMKIENNLVTYLEIDLLSLLNTEMNEEFYSYSTAKVSAEYSYDDFELSLPEGLIEYVN